MRIHRTLTAALLVALMAITAACTRSNTAQGSDSGSPRSSGKAVSSSQIQTDIAEGNFGTLKKVCGPAPASGPGKSDSQGVTADAVTIGTISDPKNAARPGLNQELFDTGEVFTKWCNDLGGINGHKINLVEHDAGLFNYKQAIIQACAKDFMLVGGGGVFDDSGQEERVRCLLPDFPGYVVTPKARNSALLLQATPAPADDVAVGTFRYIESLFPADKDKIAFMWGDLPSLATVNKQTEEAVKTFGWKVADEEQYPALGTSNWVPFAQSIANKGAKGLFYVGEPQNLALLINAFAQINYKLDFIVSGANIYDPKLIQGAGPALSIAPVYMNEGFVPFDLADQNLALGTYEALFKKYKPSGKSNALLGLNSMSAWLLFAEAAKQCTSGLTRRCVYEAGTKITSWDAGGMGGEADPGAGTPTNCNVTIKANPDGFEVIKWKANKGIFNCDPANVVTIKGENEPGVTLESVGHTMNDLH